MRAAPALQLTLERFSAWRTSVALLCAAAAASIAAWLQAGPWTAVAAALAAGVSLPLTRRVPCRLSWDGERWRLGAAGAPLDELPCGTLRVMIDVGGFLLLRFEAEGARAMQWLPVQRSGLEASWHALRCAVYSPRPAASSVPPDDPSPPA
jgi:hypothetical protein